MTDVPAHNPKQILDGYAALHAALQENKTLHRLTSKDLRDIDALVRAMAADVNEMKNRLAAAQAAVIVGSDALGAALTWIEDAIELIDDEQLINEGRGLLEAFAPDPEEVDGEIVDQTDSEVTEDDRENR